MPIYFQPKSINKIDRIILDIPKKIRIPASKPNRINLRILPRHRIISPIPVIMQFCLRIKILPRESQIVFHRRYRIDHRQAKRLIPDIPGHRARFIRQPLGGAEMIVMIAIKLSAVRLVERIGAPQTIWFPAIGLPRGALLAVLPYQSLIGRKEPGSALDTGQLSLKRRQLLL